MSRECAQPAPHLERGGLWHHRGFRLLWGGQTVSQLGSQIAIWALPLTAIYTLWADAAQMGLLLAAGTAPYLLFGLGAGVWADRVRRRALLIAADIGARCCSAPYWAASSARPSGCARPFSSWVAARCSPSSGSSGRRSGACALTRRHQTNRRLRPRRWSETPPPGSGPNVLRPLPVSVIMAAQHTARIAVRARGHRGGAPCVGPPR